MRFSIIFLLSLSAAFAAAQDRFQNLPSGAVEIEVQGQTYFYQGGYFYRALEDGYLRIAPPLGARVDGIPGGSASFSIGSDRYFLTASDTFFLYDSRGDHYTVVTPPYNWRNYYQAPLAPQAPQAQMHPSVRREYEYPGGYPDYRAQREATCRQIASDLSRRESVTGRVDSRKLRIYKDEYTSCMRDSRR
jgi:hypothetical protein